MVPLGRASCLRATRVQHHLSRRKRRSAQQDPRTRAHARLRLRRTPRQERSARPGPPRSEHREHRGKVARYRRDQGLLAANTASIEEKSPATGDFGVCPRIVVVGGVEQIPGERVKRSFDRGINATATARRWRCVIVLEAPGDCEPRVPRRRRWAMDHRRAKCIAIREPAHTKETPRKKRRLAREPEFALDDHGHKPEAGRSYNKSRLPHGAEHWRRRLTFRRRRAVSHLPLATGAPGSRSGHPVRERRCPLAVRS